MRSSARRSRGRGSSARSGRRSPCLPDIRSVGVMGDERTYGHPIIIRAVTSDDAMTADWARLPYDLLEKMSQPHHQRGARHQPRGLRHHQQAARHDRVGVTAERVDGDWDTSSRSQLFVMLVHCRPIVMYHDHPPPARSRTRECGILSGRLPIVVAAPMVDAGADARHGRRASEPRSSGSSTSSTDCRAGRFARRGVRRAAIDDKGRRRGRESQAEGRLAAGSRARQARAAISP